MTQVHAITSDNRSSYEGEIGEYFRLRHEVFVKERGWRVLNHVDGQEIDI